MTDIEKTGRPNQKRRTRKDLLQAASLLMKEGRKPSLEEVAEAALVSRATAYRYFPSIDALLYEASIDVAAPEIDVLLGAHAPTDPVERLNLVDAALDAMIQDNEPALRMMLAHSIERAVHDGPSDVPPRQNRRSPLIEAALAPVREQMSPEEMERLSAALGIVIGTESMVACRDVLQLSHDEAANVRRWAIRALVESALAKA